MCAKMHQHVGLKSMLHPQIRRDESMRGSRICSVYNLEGVTLCANSELRHENNIAQLYARYSQFTFVCR